MVFELLITSNALYMFAGGLVWIGIFLWLYLWSPWKNLLFFKGAATFISVLFAFRGAFQQGGRTWLLFLGVFLCFLADLCIHFSLIPGVLVFLTAHVMFIFWNCLQGGSGVWGLILGILGCALVVWRYKSYLSSFREKSVPLIVYVFVLLNMTGTALSLLWRIPVGKENGIILLVVGAICFLISDMILGDSIVTGRKSAVRDRWVMCLYEPAVLLLTLSVFF